MAEFDLVVRNGTVVTASDVMRADIGVRDGRVVALAERLSGGREEIDAGGKLVLPGGVDSHCHVEQIAATGARSSDDFFTGSRAAACGGTTTIVPFASQLRGQSMKDVVSEYHARARERAAIDYAFHMIVSDPTPAALERDLPELIGAGHASIKIFMCYEHRRFSDRLILELLHMARTHRAITLVHAENHDCCEFASNYLLAQGKREPYHHADGRPVVAEREATHRIISLAELAQAPIVIAHVSSAEALAEVARARRRGQRVHAETCPHYLVLNREILRGNPEIAARHVCSPPPRTAADNDAIWQGLAQHVLAIVSSDHAPTDSPYDPALDFTRLASGLPGLETRLPILFSAGVQTGRIDLNHFVALTATNPAKLFGLYPRKGTIAIGSDADLAVWDIETSRTISAEQLHYAVPFTPFEGMKVGAWPIITISRGDIVWAEGQVRLEKGRGRFLRQDTSSAYGDMPKPLLSGGRG